MTFDDIILRVLGNTDNSLIEIPIERLINNQNNHSLYISLLEKKVAAQLYSANTLYFTIISNAQQKIRIKIHMVSRLLYTHVVTCYTIIIC